MQEWETASGPKRAPPRQVAAVVMLLAVLGAIVALAGRGDSVDRQGADEAVGDDSLEVERDAPPNSPGEDVSPDASDGSDGETERAEPDESPLGEWTVVADAPISRRSDAIALWTGLEVLVWGGHEGGWHADGAAYDPGRDRWRELPTAPHAASPEAAAAWTGREMVVVGAQGQTASAYDPESDVWRELPDPPRAFVQRPAVLWSGTEIVAVGDGRADALEDGTGTVAVAYDPSRDAWRELPAPPLEGYGLGLAPRAAALDGHATLLGTVPMADGGDRLAMTAYDPEGEAWSAPDVSPIETASDSWLVGVDGDERQGSVAAAGSVRDGTWNFRAGTWTPDGGWEALPELHPEQHAVPHVAATAHGWLLWTGTSRDEGWVLTGDGWRALPESPLRPRDGAAVTWTGRDLFVWGGHQGTHALADGMRWRPRDRELEYCCSP